MPKIKLAKGSPSLDMTPMVDLAFLLVTFFMLTATMRAPEPVIVDTPSSISELVLPKNSMLITIDTAGRVFFNLEGKEVRVEMLRAMMNKFPKVKFSEEEITKFGAMQSFGVPIDSLPNYINASADERKKMDDRTQGIPMDTVETKNELAYWINFARSQFYVWQHKPENKDKNIDDLRIALKADGKTGYKKIDDVIAVFKKQDVYQFNLITDLEANPNDAPPAGARH